MFVKVTNGVPRNYTLGDLRRENPRTSFPKHIPSDVLASYDIYTVVETSPPEIDSKTHQVTQHVELVDGVWTQVWQSVEISEERAGKNVRAHRNNLLSQTDWVIVFHAEKGTSIPQEWEVYRQALRDITEQEGFPHNVQWPVSPLDQA